MPTNLHDTILSENPLPKDADTIFTYFGSAPYYIEPTIQNSGGGASAASGPVHLLVDSTGVKLSGPGEWLVEKHGTQRRRAWRKLHLGVDAKTGTIVASTLTSKEVDDAAELGPLA